MYQEQPRNTYLGQNTESIDGPFPYHWQTSKHSDPARFLGWYTLKEKSFEKIVVNETPNKYDNDRPYGNASLGCNQAFGCHKFFPKCQSRSQDLACYILYWCLDMHQHLKLINLVEKRPQLSRASDPFFLLLT